MICALVLAAGQSRRMGAQKLLLPFAGQTVIAHVVDQVLKSQARPVFVVAQADRAVADALAAKSIVVLHNPDAQGDMLSSVRAGLKALPQECEAVVVALGDQPLLAAPVLTQMIAAFREHAAKIVVPVYAGQRGHPLLLSRCYFGEMATRYDGVGLRGLIQAHPDEVYALSVDNPWVLEDMDDPDDYRQALAKLREADS